MDANDTVHLIGINEEELLDEASHEKALEMIPLDIVLIIFGVIGLIGNILVIVFYNKKSQVNPTTRLITALAATDAMSCVVMPNQVIATLMIYRFTSTALCALSVGLAYLLTISSGGFLLFIGIFRYKLVCMPLRPQFSLKQANYFIGIAIAIGLTLATPTLVFYRSEPFDVVINANITIIGAECNVAREPALETGFAVMNATHAIVFATTSILLLIMYGIMGKNIWQHNKRRAALLKTTRAAQTPQLARKQIEDPNNEREALQHDDDQMNENPTLPTIHNDGDKTRQGAFEDIQTDSKNKISAIPKQKTSTVSQKSDTSEKGETQNPDRSTKITKLCFAIYLCFTGSFFPYLALSFHKYLNPDYNSYSLFSKICYRSFLFNNVANPFIYGFFNLQFRDFVKQTIFRKCICFKKT